MHGGASGKLLAGGLRWVAMLSDLGLSSYLDAADDSRRIISCDEHELLCSSWWCLSNTKQLLLRNTKLNV